MKANSIKKIPHINWDPDGSTMQMAKIAVPSLKMENLKMNLHTSDSSSTTDEESDKKMSNDEVRELFARSGLTFNDVFDKIDTLKRYLKEKLKEHNSIEDSLYMTLSDNIKYSFIPYTRNIQCLYLKVDGTYFKNREAISFNSDGFVGFAGWASTTNSQPFVDAFADFLRVITKGDKINTMMETTWQETKWEPSDEYSKQIWIDKCKPKGYAVRNIYGYCLNREGEFEYEPLPSSRTASFLERCRFDTFEEAVGSYLKWKNNPQ